MNNVNSNCRIHIEHSKLLHWLPKVCKNQKHVKNNPRHSIEQSSIDYQTAAT